MINIEKELLKHAHMCAVANAKTLSLIEELKECDQDEFCKEIISKLEDIQKTFKCD